MVRLRSPQSWLVLGGCLAAVLHLQGCSLKPAPSAQSAKLTLEIHKSNKLTALSAGTMGSPPFSAFQCFYVNVMGDGISNGNPFFPVDWNAIRARTSCAHYPGVVSTLQSLSSIDASVDLNVPIGAARVVQVLGVLSADGSCDQSTFNRYCLMPQNPDEYDVCAQHFPSIYEVGRTTTDVYADQSVTIANQYDSDDPKVDQQCKREFTTYNPAGIQIASTPNPAIIGTCQAINVSVLAAPTADMDMRIWYNNYYGAVYNGTSCAGNELGGTPFTMAAGARTVALSYRAINPGMPEQNILTVQIPDDGSSQMFNLGTAYTISPLTITPPATNPAIIGVCQSFTMSVSPALSADMPMYIFYNGYYGSVYNDSGCLTQLSGNTFTMPATGSGSSSVTLYYKPLNPGDSTSNSIGVEIEGEGNPQWFNLGTVYTAAAWTVTIPSGAAIIGTCQPITMTVTNALSASMPMTISDWGHGTFYSEGSCTAELFGGNFTMASAATSATVYYKALTPALSTDNMITVQVVGEGSPQTTPLGTAYTTSDLSITAQSSVQIGACQPITMSVSPALSADMPMTISYSGAYGAVYTGAECTGPELGANIFTMPATSTSQSTVILYYKAISVATSGQNVLTVTTGDATLHTFEILTTP